jgi:SIT4 phosphatase-associated protein
MERLRIVELYADILHYSNMIMPNRLPGSKPAFDDTGRLVGGLAALNDLVGAMLGANGANEQAVDDEGEDEDDSTDEEGEEEEEEEDIQRPSFPISSAQRRPLYESDSDIDSTEGPHESAIISSTSADIASIGPDRSTPPVLTLPGTSFTSSIDQLAERLSSIGVPGSPAGSLRSNLKSERRPSSTSGTKSPGGASASSASRAASGLHMSPSEMYSTSTSKPIEVEELARPLGERLKERYLELGVLDTLLVSRFPSHESVFG